MSKLEIINNLKSIKDLTPELCAFLNETRDKLNGSDRRLFMAKVVKLMGYGGKNKAERYLGWNRVTIDKGLKELDSGFTCVDNFSSRGRKKVESQLPNLLNDINNIVKPICQTDPTFRSTNLYSPITALEVRQRLISEKNYTNEELPTVRTISNKLNEIGYTLKKVQKLKPKKK